MLVIIHIRHTVSVRYVLAIPRLCEKKKKRNLSFSRNSAVQLGEVSRKSLCNAGRQTFWLFFTPGETRHKLRSVAVVKKYLKAMGGKGKSSQMHQEFLRQGHASSAFFLPGSLRRGTNTAEKAESWRSRRKTTTEAYVKASYLSTKNPRGQKEKVVLFTS